MTAQPLHPDAFPTLRVAGYGPAAFDAALALIVEGQRAGAIRNAVLAEAKHSLSRAVDDAWHAVTKAHFHGKADDHPESVMEVYYATSIMGLHDVIAASKRMARSKGTGPAMEAMRAFCAEALPLSLAVASLKDKVVKGRAPSAAPPAPVNPNKSVLTCAVCFRPVASTGKGMAHHGYRRPRPGMQSASCAGVRFPALEISDAGLKWSIESLHEDLRKTTAALRAAPSLTDMYVRNWDRTGPPLMKIEKGHSRWASEFEDYVAELKGSLQAVKRSLPKLEKMLAGWKQTVLLTEHPLE